MGWCISFFLAIGEGAEVVVDKELVNRRVSDMMIAGDVSKYIL